MNGAGLWLPFTIAFLSVLLVCSMRATRYWINACQKQMTKRWQERLPVDTDQIATVLGEHRIRWVSVPDPDHDERMPDVGNYVPECPTCGPMTGLTDVSVHQASVLATRLNKGRLRTTAEDFGESAQQPPPGSMSGPAPHVHRLEVEISGGRVFGLLNGDIRFKGVCDAEEGAPCRMWCNDPDCREEAGEDHGNHALFDQGECGVIGALNADRSMIPELYEGPKGPLRSGAINLKQDIDGITWQYAEETILDLEMLLRYNSVLVEYHGNLIEYRSELDDYRGDLSAAGHGLEECHRRLQGVSASLEQQLVNKSNAVADDASGDVTACQEECRHRCPECRLGLGTHLECDPLCAHHITAASQ